VVIAWLAAMAVFETARIVSRFILAPTAPGLRLLPLGDAAATYLFRWTVHLARVVAAGLLVTAVIRLEGGSEALTLLVTTLFGLGVAVMLVLMALWNRKPVAEAIRAGAAPDSLAAQLAPVWHLAALAYVLVFWGVWVLGLMIVGARALLPGMVTLLIIPGCLLTDYAAQRLVDLAVGMAEPKGPDVGPDVGGDAGQSHAGQDGAVAPIVRFRRFLSTGFRVLILAAAAFALLRAWGIDIEVGRAVVHAAINTLVTLVLAYVFWVFVSRFIERKLREKQGATPGEDAGEGGGGPGGDRFSTLLHLVRKFIFAAIAVVTVLVVLSSLGIDIGPLIAGASVFGIAIGFGAQTLVKDIISGIFFFMDDAFRVGDYIEVGSACGTVEQISVRSFKLRHHLGMLYTIPFGSVKEIKNMSRDWAVMKLQYLVPFDTDIGRIKKIIKEINKEIRAVPELDALMLDDIKSQGVKAMEEHGMRMRVKFMTRPGGQFTLRKLVLARMRRKFDEAGIEFARPRVSVEMPADTELSSEQATALAAAAGNAVRKKTPPGEGGDF
jgi:small-conductance mechanosensitive channel